MTIRLFLSISLTRNEKNYHRLQVDIEKMDNDQTIYTDAVFKDGNKQEERLEDGIVNITRFDLNNRIISGTFEGRRVTEGRFDLTF